jgi:hypothetical protein
MNQSLNQGNWKLMEMNWATKIQNGTNITDLKIDIQYGGNGRPTGFDVKWYENGIRKTLYHPN